MAEFVLSAKDEASAVFERVKASATSLGSQVNAIRFGALGLAASAAAGYFAATAKAGLDTADSLNKLSQKVGISVERLSELKFAAELSDVSMEQFQVGMKTLNDTLVKAGDATSKEAQLLKTLGVTARDPERALRQLADAFAVMPDGATKSAIAVDLLGKAGQNMIPLLNGGSAAIDATAASARRLGLTMNSDTARAAEEFNDNMKKLATSSEALGASLANKLAKPLATFTSGLVKAKEEARLFEKVLQDVIGTSLEIAARMPGFGGVLFDRTRDLHSAGVAGAETARTQAAEIVANAQLYAAQGYTGAVMGPPDLRPQRDREAAAACVLSGGAWDAAARRCIPKPTGPKQESLDEMMSRFALRGQQERDRLSAEAEGRGEREEQERLQLAADRALQELERQEALERAGEEAHERLREEARAWKELIDPVAKHRNALERIDELERKGALTAQEALEARFKVQTEIDEELDRLGAKVKENDDLARDLGLTFSSAFEDAIVGGKKLSEVLKAVGADIARIVVRKSITEPLAGEISKLVGGGGGSGAGGGLVDWVRKFFGFGGVGGFATGGSFTVGGAGGMDSQLVAFRATPGERVTVETPAQQRAGTPTVVLNIGAGTPAGIRAEVMQMLPSIQSAVLAGVLDAKRRGGGFGSSF